MCINVRLISFRRVGAFLTALSLCFALSVPAFADELITGNSDVYFVSRPANDTSDFFSIVQAERISFPVSSLTLVPDDPGSAYALSQVPLVSLVSEGSAAGVYLSFYYSSNDSAKQNRAPLKSDFVVLLYSEGSDTPRHVSASSFSIFAPSSSANSLSDGASYSFRFENSLGDPSTTISVYPASLSYRSPLFYFEAVSGAFSTSPALVSSNKIVITSYRLVSTSSSAELDALESMADSISQQNQILSQYYGDIISVCNSIYSRLGDMQAAQEEANALFSNVIKLLNTTNGKLDAINMAMSTYFELLINQLKQEGIDTRTAIADAEARLELYLKPMIDYFNELEEQTGESASTLPQHKTDIDVFDNQGYGIESDGQAGLSAILPIFTTFSFVLSVLGIFIGLGILKVIIKKGLS